AQERARGESEAEQPEPEGPELAERAVLKVDVIPAVEEKACDEGCREEARDHVLAPDRLRSHAASFPHHARFGFAAYTRREATSEGRLYVAGVSCMTLTPSRHAAGSSRCSLLSIAVWLEVTVSCLMNSVCTGALT